MFLYCWTDSASALINWVSSFSVLCSNISVWCVENVAITGSLHCENIKRVLDETLKLKIADCSQNVAALYNFSYIILLKLNIKSAGG